MGTQIACFNLSQINALSKSLGEYMTGSEITRLLMQCGIQDTSGESTKWKRLEHTFISRQNNDRAPNAILRFVEEALQPVKFTENQATYEAFLTATNNVLIMAGVEMGKDGKLRSTTKAVTIDEVIRRTDSLRQKLSQRGVHSTVLKYCREELLKENYFHAVLEAAKSLSDRVRYVSNWVGNFDMMLEEVANNTSETEVLDAYGKLRIQLNNDILQFLMKDDQLSIENAQRAIAETYFLFLPIEGSSNFRNNWTK